MSIEKRRIGLVISNIDTGWAQSVWPSFVKTSAAENGNLFIFPGGRLDAPMDNEYLRNPIYSLVNSENLDGFIIWSSSIKFRESNEAFEEFHSKFNPLPFVTLAYKVKDHPCVEFDGYTGVKKLIKHCIEVHGAKRIAFLRGPEFHPHAEDRLIGYLDALKEAGMPVNKDDPLITDPFGWGDGRAAAAQLFESRNLKPGVDFDTIFGVSDLLTHGAMNYFADYGYHVPSDYRALGFNNSIESKITECLLTTVEAPYSSLSSESVGLLKRLMDSGEQVDDVLLPTKPIFQESCGCIDTSVLPIIDELGYFPEGAVSKKQYKDLTAMIMDYFNLSKREMTIVVAPFLRAWDTIVHEADSLSISPYSVKTFFYLFEKMIIRFFETNREKELIVRFLKEIQRSALVSLPLYRLFESDLLRITFMVRERIEMRSLYKMDRENMALNFLKCQLLGTRDRAVLMQSLARYLPSIGIHTAGLALYRDNSASLWVGSFSQTGMSQVKNFIFPSNRLVPLPEEGRFSQGVFIVEPLFTENESLGYFVHSISGSNGVIFEDLRTTISYAIKGIFQFEEVEKAEKLMMRTLEQSRILVNQREAAQAASEAKSLFLANISHEIRTPMNAVLGMSELLLSEKLNKRQRRYAEDINISAMALLEIINDILDISKIQSGSMKLLPTHYDFKTFLDNIGSMVVFLLRGKDVVFKTEIHGVMPKCLYGDDVRLRQILINILSNAVKFTQAGQVNMEITVSEAFIRFTISDTGIGMRAEAIETIFDAFTQLDLEKNRYRKGTGLGLSITKALVDMMNGHIEVDSIYGQGTVFTVEIPKVLGDEKKISSAKSEENVLCSPDTKILVVDDNAINLNVVSGLLRLCNISAFTATSGRQAIEMAKKENYDLVFMDHMMPEMDGVEASKIMRQAGITAPIIALTANAVSSAKEMMLSEGMDDFLSKPIVKEELNGILARWVPSSKRIVSKAPAGSEGNVLGTAGRELSEKLKQIKGLSTVIGLERVLGQTDVYEESLRLLVREIGKCKRSLDRFLDIDDMLNFSIDIHSMKSSLANLGAMELAEKAHDLEDASEQRDIDYCRSNLGEFFNALSELGENLSAAFPVQYQSGIAMEIPANLAKLLERMTEACKRIDFEAINSALNELETYKLRGELKEEIEDVMDAVMVMDYDRVMEIIKHLLDGTKTTQE